MTKYFSKDTPLASLERMMMSVPGFQKRGGGMMVLCRFHYKKEDVDCAYCQSYMRHTCQASVCPYIPERLEAGTVSYQELAEGCLHMAGHQKLWNRLSSLPKGKSLPLVLEPAHRRRLSEWLEAGIATSCPHELAAAYLLSSRAGLWRRVLPHISHGRIDFSSISLRGIDPRDYERNEWGDIEDYSTELEGGSLRNYEGQILKALIGNRMPEEAESGIMHWYDVDDEVNRKVRSVVFTVEEHDRKLWGVAECRVIYPAIESGDSLPVQTPLLSGSVGLCPASARAGGDPVTTE